MPGLLQQIRSQKTDPITFDTLPRFIDGLFRETKPKKMIMQMPAWYLMTLDDKDFIGWCMSESKMINLSVVGNYADTLLVSERMKRLDIVE